MPTPVLIKDLISLPERVQPGDFVLRLSEGVSEAGAAATLRDYTVTADLARARGGAAGAARGPGAERRTHRRGAAGLAGRPAERGGVREARRGTEG
jgi:hypothetical protein